MAFWNKWKEKKEAEQKMKEGEKALEEFRAVIEEFRELDRKILESKPPLFNPFTMRSFFEDLYEDGDPSLVFTMLVQAIVDCGVLVSRSTYEDLVRGKQLFDFMQASDLYDLKSDLDEIPSSIITDDENQIGQDIEKLEQEENEARQRAREEMNNPCGDDEYARLAKTLSSAEMAKMIRQKGVNRGQTIHILRRVYAPLSLNDAVNVLESIGWNA